MARSSRGTFESITGGVVSHKVCSREVWPIARVEDSFEAPISVQKQPAVRLGEVALDGAYEAAAMAEDRRPERLASPCQDSALSSLSRCL